MDKEATSTTKLLSKCKIRALRIAKIIADRKSVCLTTTEDRVEKGYNLHKIYKVSGLNSLYRVSRATE